MYWQLPTTLVLSLLAQFQYSLAVHVRSYDTHNFYVLEHDPYRSVPLDEVAASLGVEVVEQVGELRNHWLVRTRRRDLAGREPGSEFDHVIERYKSLRSQSSRKRDRDVSRSIKYLERQTLKRRTKRAPPPVQPTTLTGKAAQHFDIKDPLFEKQWHLVNNEFAENMLNVTPVWEMGLTGKGVITSFIDDGLDYTSEDLKDNFVAEYSHDYNDNEDLPTPKLYDDHHGTRCAGQVAAQKNGVCGIGIAYTSKVAGVRILSGPISDADEAAALNFGFHNVSIYSCSWGPPDNGQTMEGPSLLIRKAMVNGIENGRQGKGSIFVFASGNGAAQGDQCNFDGYTNSIYSVTVSAIDYKDMHPYYSEPCAANMIVAYSSGSGKSIVTTDRGENECTSGHGGTSAAAPNAAGVIALGLEARPDLGWRDVQHLCIRTSRKIAPDDPDWEETASGRPYSYKYGYGAIDAYAFVKAAQGWELVKPQSWYHSPTIQLEDGTMDENETFSGGTFITNKKDGVQSKFTMTKEIMGEANLERLEHINVKVWIQHTRRGDVEVELTSPGGVKSMLAWKRNSDADTTGYPGWTFMTVKHWDEDPIGDWTIRVWDQNQPESNNGSFLGWNMIFWGESLDPKKTTTYELPTHAYILPPPPEPPAVAEPSATTKQHLKPTAHLPGDHGEAEGENDKPAFGGSSDAPAQTGEQDIAEQPSATSTPTADEGWVAGMGKLGKSGKWLFGAISVVVLFGVGACVFIVRRRAARRRDAYSALGEDGEDDGVGMSTFRGGRASSGGGGRTKELYDAFGEVSDDDDEYADEQTRLRPAVSAENLALHEGFLDDDPPTAGGQRYRDEPEGEGERERDRGNVEESSSGSGSGDGSWEHASTSLS